MVSMRIRLAVQSDCAQLAQFCEALWPQSSAEEHERELTPILQGKHPGSLPLVVFVAEGFDGALLGFIEVGLRSHADGCDPHVPVGFVEGWLVVEGERKKGIGRQLMTAAEQWARSQGCKEMASDTWLDNDVSQRVHQALKFEVVDRCVHYRKAL
jgi:aminoglycoside 6'-N-acetyltransferase I